MARALEFRNVFIPGVCAALLLSACGGSSSSTTTLRSGPSGGDSPAGTPSGNDDFSGTGVQDYFTGPDATLKAGAFLGALSYRDGNPPPVDGFMLLSATGNFAFVLDTPSTELNANIVVGTLALDGLNIEGKVVEYELLDAWFRSTGSLVEPSQVISNETALLYPGGRVVEVEMTRDTPASDQSLGLSEQIASGTGRYQANGSGAQVTIDTGGVITGVDRGCILQGQITIPVAQINIFELSYQAAGCSDLAGEATGSQRDGQYRGVGTFTAAAAGEGGDIEFAASNGKIALAFAGTR